MHGFRNDQLFIKKIKPLFEVSVLHLSMEPRDQWIKEDWPVRKTLPMETQNVINPTLVVRKINLPPLHLKLGIMKQFVEELEKFALFLFI